MVLKLFWIKMEGINLLFFAVNAKLSQEELFASTTKKTQLPQAPQQQVPEVIDLEQAETQVQQSLDYWIGRRDLIHNSKALTRALEQLMRKESYSFEVLELAFIDIKSNYQKNNISFNVPPPKNRM